jgi:hypothetical protein
VGEVRPRDLGAAAQCIFRHREGNGPDGSKFTYDKFIITKLVPANSTYNMATGREVHAMAFGPEISRRERRR